MAERRFDHDREIALQQIPRTVRGAFSALWALDLAFADIIATSSDPRLAAVRLAWWRERLEELDTSAAKPAEPRLQAVAEQLLSRGISGNELSKLEDAWFPALEPFPWRAEQADGFRQRGRILFGVGARLLGEESRAAEAAGELWSLADGALHCSDEPSRDYLARQTVGARTPSVPRKIRVLTTIAALALADLDGAGSLGRGFAALGHRLTGRMPERS